MKIEQIGDRKYASCDKCYIKANGEICGERIDPIDPIDPIEYGIRERYGKEAGYEYAKTKRARTNQPESDVINHPSHYADKQIEVIDYMRDTLTREQFEGYCIGNVIKYVSRYRKKGGAEDLKKAQVYLGWVIECMEIEKEPT